MALSDVSHEPPGYACPFCAIAGGAEPEFTAWREGQVFVQIAKHWDPGGPGRALVIPTIHYENIYALPDDLAGKIARMVRLVATAMRQWLSLRRGCRSPKQRTGRRAGRVACAHACGSEA